MQQRGLRNGPQPAVRAEGGLKRTLPAFRSRAEGKRGGWRGKRRRSLAERQGRREKREEMQGREREVAGGRGKEFEEKEKGRRGSGEFQKS